MADRNYNGTFKKGHTGAKPIGAKNKVTLALKEKIQLFLEGYSIDKMQDDFKKLDPKERLQIFTGLVEYIQPKLERFHAAFENSDRIIKVTIPDE